MSLLTHLSIPENFVTEGLLLHVSLLPRLEELIVSPAPRVNALPGRECHGFASLRSLDIPNGTLLHRFLSYQVGGLEALRVGNLGSKSLPALARKLPNLLQLSIEGQKFTPQEMFVLGACFQLEEIAILTQCPLGMADLDLHRFRAMFRNLRSLSITTRDSSSCTELRRTTRRGTYPQASRVFETKGRGHGA